MPALIDFLSGAVGSANQRIDQQRQLQQAIQLEQMKQKIKSQNQQINPSQILSQLELRNIVQQMGGGGQLGQGQQPQQFQRPGIAPTALPQGQPFAQRQPVQGQVPQRQPIQGQPVQGQPTPQRQPIGAPQIQPPQYREVPTSRGRFGQIQTKFIEDPAAVQQRKLAEQKGKADIKRQEEIKSGQRMAAGSFNLIGGAINEFSQTFADAVREQGVGSKLAQVYSGASLFLGGKQAEKFPNTAALPGQTTEVIARMMPILTQQGDKPGSVRLVSTVFDKLELTLPQGNTPPKNARKMMEKSLLNMYRFTRAARVLGISNETVENLPDEQVEALSNQIANLARKIPIQGNERKELDNFINNALKPIDEVISERGQPKGVQRIPTPVGQPTPESQPFSGTTSSGLKWSIE